MVIFSAKQCWRLLVRPSVQVTAGRYICTSGPINPGRVGGIDRFIRSSKSVRIVAPFCKPPEEEMSPRTPWLHFHVESVYIRFCAKKLPVAQA